MRKAYPLGIWQSNQRVNYKKGKLSPERIKLLEDIGFTWEMQEEKFKKGFQATLLYKESTGNPNATATYKTAEGYPLSAWQASQRARYKIGKLSPERIKLLDDIGFTWDTSGSSETAEMLEEQFEKGFQQTLLYKESMDNPNAPPIYKTHEGYHLGAWQNRQKEKYGNGKLSPDKIKRLEDIGFKWGKQR